MPHILATYHLVFYPRNGKRINDKKWFIDRDIDIYIK